MNGTKITAEFTDLDEAVMEMQPDQRRGHPGLPGDGPRHDGPDDLLGPGARAVVERREQAAAPRVAAGGAGEEDDGEHETQQGEAAATRGSGRHGSSS